MHPPLATLISCILPYIRIFLSRLASSLLQSSQYTLTCLHRPMVLLVLSDAAPHCEVATLLKSGGQRRGFVDFHLLPTSPNSPNLSQTLLALPDSPRLSRLSRLSQPAILPMAGNNETSCAYCQKEMKTAHLSRHWQGTKTQPGLRCKVLNLTLCSF
jgi:hypothetical protein